MIQHGVPRLDLYTFVSVFIPGLVLVIGLLPFAPTALPMDSLSMIIALAVFGFVVGRLIHTMAVTLQSRFGGPSHRDTFKHELKYSSTLSEETINEFWKELDRIIEHGVSPPTHQRNGSAVQNFALPRLLVDQPVAPLSVLDIRTEELSDDDYRSIYVIVRSIIHMDGSGRSRTFQSVYAFHRSMVLVCFILAMVYISLITLFSIGWQMPVDYNPYLQEKIASGEVLETDSFQLMVSLFYVLLLGAMRTFDTSRDDFREYFVQYLISDFILLSKELDYENDSF